MIIDGKKIAEDVNAQTKDEVSKIISESKPKLAIILIGNNPESLKYISHKEKKAKELGMQTSLLQYEPDTKLEEIVVEIEKLNVQNDVNGILLQLPLPSEFADRYHKDVSRTLLERIIPSKDVDGLTFNSIARYYTGDESGFLPATAQGVIKMLDDIKFDYVGKNVCVIGRSMVAGKPTAAMLTNRDSVVTMLHSKVSDLSEYTKRADAIISCVGKPNLITSSLVKDQAIVIDVGINVVDGKLVGDADFDVIKDKCSYISPVPGGVGPLTVAFLMKNLLKGYINQNAK